MLAIAFTFPGGRYHATPWGRHVNEADLEWPPSPWRITRSLIAVWYRKLDPRRRDITVLERLLAKLAVEAPYYRVPEAIHAHTRHYMPGKADKKALIFDAFARLDAGRPLTAVWPRVDLDVDEIAVLDELLAGLGFLGRAESWSDAARLSEWSGQYNCVPGDEAVDMDTGEAQTRVSLFAPMTREAYTKFREAQLEGLDKRADLKVREKNLIKASLPESWLGAVALDTADLRAAGWNSPPAARGVSYVRPPGLLRQAATIRPHVHTSRPVTTFRFALYGKPLPRIEDAVRVGEWLRRAIISRVGEYCGDSIPPVVSGHGLSEQNRHQHAFWLVEDADGDGRIDHLLVHVPAYLDGKARLAVESFRQLWNSEGQKWQVVFEGAGESSRFAGHRSSKICGVGQKFESITPYLMPWHAKKNFTIEDQIRRECKERGLPEIANLAAIPSIHINGRELHPIHFHRFRSKRGLMQPDSRGSFWRITFGRPVQGPLAIGFGCHFGLGIFRPEIV